MALESGWGGKDSQLKRSQLKTLLIDYLCAHKTVYADEIQEILFNFMNDSFYTNLEDNSDKEIADILTTLHGQLQNGDLTLLNALETQINPCKIDICQPNQSDSSSCDEESQSDWLG